MCNTALGKQAWRVVARGHVITRALFVEGSRRLRGGRCEEVILLNPCFLLKPSFVFVVGVTWNKPTVSNLLVNYCGSSQLVAALVKFDWFSVQR